MWDWPHCDYGGGDRELSGAFMEGPDANCPAGKWKTALPQSTQSAQRKSDSEPRDSLSSAASALSAVNWCVFARRAACCAKRFECRRDADAVRMVKPEECNEDCARRVERLKISAVITAWNEGDEVRKTVESLAASIVDPRTELEVIVVDDGSTDGSCQFDVGARRAVPTRVLRHEQPQGVGRSRNHGWREATGNVITFHDAHMRFGPLTPDDPVQAGGLEKLARRALQHEGSGIGDRGSGALSPDPGPRTPDAVGAIVCAGSAGLRVVEGQDQPIGNRLFCCDLFYNQVAALQPKWLHVGKLPPDEWARSPCLMGAGYVMSRATAEVLEAATGSLWEDTAGRWGFSEEALAVKAFLLDMPVYFSRDVIIRHLYRKSNPLKDAGTEKMRNVTRATAVLFGPEIWEERFKSWCVKRLDKKEVAGIAAEAFEASPREWTRPPEDVFTHLCGKRASITERHPDHAWLDDVEAACSKLETRNSEPGTLRVLAWRPGESTILVRRLLPDAEVRCLELRGHRAANWFDWCKDHNVAQEQVDLGPDYARRPLLWEKKSGNRGFDLVLIGGEMQDECRRVAAGLLRPGGAILVNPAADRLQIEDKRRKEEEELLKQHSPRRAQRTQRTADVQSSDVSAGSAPSAVKEPLVTVVLLNWKRPENIGSILECLAGQTVPLQVFLWNNGPATAGLPAAEHPLVKLSVSSSRNLGCFPRWQLATLADTEFVCSLDDDLALADERVLEDAIEACRRDCPDGIVGFFGWEHVDGKGYKAARHVNGSKENRGADIIKGRFALFRRDLLQRVPLAVPSSESGVSGWTDSKLETRDPKQERPEALLFRCDDIYLSLCVAGGRWGRHLVPGALGRRWNELGQDSRSLASDPGHYECRGRAVKTIRQWLQGRQGSGIGDQGPGPPAPPHGRRASPDPQHLSLLKEVSDVL